MNSFHPLFGSSRRWAMTKQLTSSPYTQYARLSGKLFKFSSTVAYNIYICVYVLLFLCCCIPSACCISHKISHAFYLHNFIGVDCCELFCLQLCSSNWFLVAHLSEIDDRLGDCDFQLIFTTSVVVFLFFPIYGFQLGCCQTVVWVRWYWFYEYDETKNEI